MESRTNPHGIVEGMLVDLYGMKPSHPECKHYTRGIVTRVYVPIWETLKDDQTGFGGYYASVCWPTSRGGVHHYQIRYQLIPSKSQDTCADG